MRNQAALSQYLRNTGTPYGDDSTTDSTADRWIDEGTDDSYSSDIGSAWTALAGDAAGGVTSFDLGASASLSDGGPSLLDTSPGGDDSMPAATRADATAKTKSGDAPPIIDHIPALVDEVTFISGVNGGIVQTPSYWAWNGDNPATYTNDPQSRKWGGNTIGTGGGTVTYYFAAGSNWTATEENALVSGLALWSAESNISFSLASSQSAAWILFVRATDGNAQTSPPTDTVHVTSSTESNPDSQVTISIDTSFPGNGFGPIGAGFDVEGSYPYDTLVHEEGHAIGLGHGGPYNGNDDSSTQQYSPYDTRLWSIMSYIDPWDSNARYFSNTGTDWGLSPDNYDYEPTTPMMLDIQAAQRLYGAPTSGPLTTAQTFGFHTTLVGSIARYFDFTINTHPVITIYDTATGNTLDLSGFTTDDTINLNPGSFSSVNGATNDIGIDASIAVAIGGSGSDLFIPNPNVITRMTGGGGNDTFQGTQFALLDDTITDMNVGDVINITDATLGSFFVSRVGTAGTALFYGTTYQNQSNELLLSNRPIDGIRLAADATYGGVDISLAAPSAPLTLGTPAVGFIFHDGDQNWSPVTLTAGASYMLREDGSFTGAGTLTDPYLQVFSNTGALLASDDDTGPGLDSLIDFTATYTGTYYLSAEAYGPVAGSYAVSAQLDSQPQDPDFNSNGFGDILLSNNGGLGDWLITNDAVTGGGGINTLPAGYHYAGAGDFNGDLTTDLLLEDTTGGLGWWKIHNGTFAGGGGLLNLPAGYNVVGTGDFNGDGTTDILVQTGATLGDWIILNGANAGGNGIGALPAGWSVVGTGDFNGDGTTDVLIQDGPFVGYWKLHNGTYAGGGSIATLPAGWSLVGNGDFNGDGTTDLLVKVGTNLYDWTVKNGVLNGANSIGALPSGWSLDGVGDFNRDGTSDLLIQNGTTLGIWQIHNGTLQSSAGLQSLPVGWTVIPQHLG